MLLFHKGQPTVSQSRDSKNYVQSNFNLDLHITLSNIDWDSDNPNKLWKNFKTTFNYVADVHALTKFRRRRVRSQKAPWLKDESKENKKIRSKINNFKTYTKFSAHKGFSFSEKNVQEVPQTKKTLETTTKGKVVSFIKIFRKVIMLMTTFIIWSLLPLLWNR